MGCTEWTPKLSCFFFFICLHTLRTVAFFMMSYPVSRVNRFAFNPLALAALVSVLCGLQQISQTSSSSLLASDSALLCWEIASGDVATDSATCENQSTDSFADEDGEATDSATRDEGATDSVTSEDGSTDALADEDGATDSTTRDEVELDFT